MEIHTTHTLLIRGVLSRERKKDSVVQWAGFLKMASNHQKRLLLLLSAVF